MNAAFTPGPWYASGHSVYEEAERVRTPEQRQGGQINIPLMTAITGRGEAIKNAILAAAAPELYEALLHVRGKLIEALARSGGREDECALLQEIDPALAKARGES